jgi:hypothetical protein
VLKKIALVAATSAAAAVAAAPFAMAHEASSTVGIDKSGKGLINVSGNDTNVPVQACNNEVPVNGGVLPIQGNVKEITGAATGALGILGRSSAKTAVSTDSSDSCGIVSGAGDKVG